jgi:hypothetical protein
LQLEEHLQVVRPTPGFPSWWNIVYDKGLLIGISKYGLERKEYILSDPDLPFLDSLCHAILHEEQQKGVEHKDFHVYVDQIRKSHAAHLGLETPTTMVADIHARDWNSVIMPADVTTLWTTPSPGFIEDEKLNIIATRARDHLPWPRESFVVRRLEDLLALIVNPRRGNSPSKPPPSRSRSRRKSDSGAGSHSHSAPAVKSGIRLTLRLKRNDESPDATAQTPEFDPYRHIHAPGSGEVNASALSDGPKGHGGEGSSSRKRRATDGSSGSSSAKRQKTSNVGKTKSDLLKEMDVSDFSDEEGGSPVAIPAASALPPFAPANSNHRGMMQISNLLSNSPVKRM